jgi:CheY-like chemotaxis protein
MSDILIINDNNSLLQDLQQRLGELHCSSDIAQGAGAGLRQWEAGQYRLVIADCRLSDLDGVALITQLRATETQRGIARRVPVMAWTTDDSGDTIRQCLAAGMNGFVQKPLATPVAMDTLRAIVEVWLPQDMAPSPPVMNERTLREISGADRDAEKEIFGHLLCASVKDRIQLHAAITQRDAAQSRLISHRIKGAYLILGAEPLSATLQRIELSSRNGDWPAILAELAGLEREFQRLSRFVKERLEHP